MYLRDGEAHSRYFVTDDGVRLHYLEAGSGPDMLLLPGWTLTAELWHSQIREFSRTHHVIAVDHRGQGKSSKPTHGYRIARLAADVHQLVTGLDLSGVTLVAHSMGCAVTWSFWELFGGNRVSSMVLIDQPPVLVAHPHWPEGLAEKLGVVFDIPAMAALTSALRGPEAEKITRDTLAMMWSPELPEADRRWIADQSLLMPTEASGSILFDNAMQDWRGLLPQITVPVLLVAGELSMFPVAGSTRAAAEIPESTLRVVSAAERGSHLSFLENPIAVNEAIRAFLGERSPRCDPAPADGLSGGALPAAAPPRRTAARRHGPKAV